MKTAYAAMLHKNKTEKDKYGEFRDPDSPYCHSGCKVMSNKLFRAELKVCFRIAVSFC
jgi:hypothetical protein